MPIAARLPIWAASTLAAVANARREDSGRRGPHFIINTDAAFLVDLNTEHLAERRPELRLPDRLNNLIAFDHGLVSFGVRAPEPGNLAITQDLYRRRLPKELNSVLAGKLHLVIISGSIGRGPSIDEHNSSAPRRFA